MLAEAFNIANHRNWSSFNGNQSATNFRKPRDASDPRQVQLGVRVDF